MKKTIEVSENLFTRGNQLVIEIDLPANLLVSDDVKVLQADDTSKCKPTLPIRPLERANDEQVRRAMLRLMDARDSEGNYLFTYKSQWIAVYRVLRDMEVIGKEYIEFVRYTRRLGMDSSRMPCSYTAIRNISGMFAKPLDDWHIEKYKGNTGVFSRNLRVAKKFMALLKEEMQSAR